MLRGSPLHLCLNKPPVVLVNTRFFASGFFHESSSPKPLKIENVRKFFENLCQ